MKDALALFFAVVIVGLLFIIAREHEPQPAMALVQAGERFACVPPMSHWQFKQRRIA